MSGMVMIEGLWFMSLHHHDGRFVRGGGRFALSRLDADGGRTVFCLEEAADISRAAGPGHSAWAYAVSSGMNEILVHLAGAKRPITPGGGVIEGRPVRFALQAGASSSTDIDQAA
jgi:hypothetical protein